MLRQAQVFRRTAEEAGSALSERRVTDRTSLKELYDYYRCFEMDLGRFPNTLGYS